MMLRVSAGAAHTDAGHDCLILVHELEPAGLGQRHVVVGTVVDARSIIQVSRVFPFASPGDVPGTRKTRPEAAVGAADGETTRVIEMKVRREHDVDLLGPHAGFLERLSEPSTAFDTQQLAGAVVSLVAQAGVNQHGPDSPHE